MQLKKTKLWVEQGRRAVTEEAGDCAGSNPGRGDGRASGPGPELRLARMHLLSPMGKGGSELNPRGHADVRGIPSPVIPA